MMMKPTAAGRQLEAALRKQSAGLIIEVASAPRDSMIRIRVETPTGTALIESQAPSGPVLVTIEGHTVPVIVESNSRPLLLHLTPSEIAAGVLEIVRNAAATSDSTGLLLSAKGPVRRSFE
ncbi:hypothetical protein ABH924_003286 [Arthrobacter sp. GAS37]|uniref:hypothetical protein n=1 Tax=Arthrobacter sp. GAS37 TaxID=3156261 RepID=UPI0038367BEE